MLFMAVSLQPKKLVNMTENQIIIKAMSIWRKHALVREGKRIMVYKDSLGKLTVGIGHLVLKKDKLNLGDIITNEQVYDLFENDSMDALAVSVKQAKELKRFNADFLASLISVNFQLGDFAKKFTTSYPLLKQGKSLQVKENLLKSAWYKQTPRRVYDFIEAIEREYA